MICFVYHDESKPMALSPFTFCFLNSKKIAFTANPILSEKLRPCKHMSSLQIMLKVKPLACYVLSKLIARLSFHHL